SKTPSYTKSVSWQHHRERLSLFRAKKAQISFDRAMKNLTSRVWKAMRQMREKPSRGVTAR
ncbi:hypothetical protein, partial [Pantoea vagans]|uniref:hypothetical protein n=2 Tax=Pantoea TaxID=53335 RepID=UPI0019553F30